MGNFGKHTPFLLTACNHSDKEKNGFTLYSISDKLHFEFDKPFVHKKLFIGSQHGWLTVLDLIHCEPTLLNPWTGESISLPSVTTFPQVRPHHSVNGNIVSYFSRANYRPESPFLDCAFDDYAREKDTFKKVLLSSNPSVSSRNFFAAALVGPGCGTHLMIAKPGEGRWNLLEEEEWYEDIMFCQDKLICLTEERAKHEVELKDDDFLITEMAAPFGENTDGDLKMYLALDSAGRILVIYRKRKFETGPETSNVEVFRLTGSKGEESKWERINSLDGQAIFVGNNAFFSLRKQDISGEVKPDTIYFTDEWWDVVAIGDDEESNSEWPRDICAYDLMSNSIKPCCPEEHRQCLWPIDNKAMDAASAGTIGDCNDTKFREDTSTNDESSAANGLL